jgi:SAM-dependent methyltransferase
MAAAREPSIDDVRRYWDEHPVAAEAIAAEPGSPEFFAAFDALREAEDCEPYAFSNEVHGYETAAGKRVLDVGCGNGYVLSRYARHGAEVHGVDLSATAIGLSRKRFELAGLAGRFQAIDGVRLPYPDGHFDIVCSMGVLHHIPDPAPTVAEMHRVLKPGGQVIVMLYNRWSWKYVVLFRLKRLADPRYRGMSQQEALNRNDGAGCPLAMVYSAAEARRLLGAFQQHQIRRNQLSWRQLLLLGPLARAAGRLVGPSSETWLARALGWNLYVTARKRNSA